MDQSIVTKHEIDSRQWLSLAMSALILMDRRKRNRNKQEKLKSITEKKTDECIRFDVITTHSIHLDGDCRYRIYFHKQYEAWNMTNRIASLNPFRIESSLRYEFVRSAIITSLRIYCLYRSCPLLQLQLHVIIRSQAHCSTCKETSFSISNQRNVNFNRFSFLLALLRVFYILFICSWFMHCVRCSLREQRLIACIVSSVVMVCYYFNWKNASIHLFIHFATHKLRNTSEFAQSDLSFLRLDYLLLISVMQLWNRTNTNASSVHAETGTRWPNFDSSNRQRCICVSFHI